MDVFCVNFLPGLTPDGKSILFFKLMDTNLDKLNHEDQMKIFMMVLDLHLMRNGPSINVGIADMDGMTLAHMMKMNLSLSRKCHFLTEEAPILKVKGFHHINSVSFVDKIMSYLKKVAYTKEFFDMVYFYPPGEMEKLFEHIPKSMMPKNYGGDGPSIEELHSMMKKDLIENADYFNEEEMTRRVNEELRPELEVTWFLHSGDYDVEKSKNIIDLHYSCRTLTPEIFSNRTIDEDLQKQMDAICLNFLPGLTPNGNSVLFMRFLDKNPEIFEYADQLRMFMMVLDLHLMRNGPINFNVLVDMEGMTMKHMMRLNATLGRKCHFMMEEAPPMKIKGMFHMNSVSFIDKIMALVKSVTYRQESLDMIQFFPADKLDAIFEFIPKTMMPKNYGGDGPSVEELHNMMKKDLIENADFFKEEESTRRVNEELRPGGPKTSMDLFGFEGSFQELEFD